MVNPDICTATQRCNMTSETCESLPSTPGADMAVLPAAPGSYILPGGRGGIVTTLTWPRDVRYQLAALDPATKLYFTTDGSVPAMGQSGTMSAVTPALDSVVAGGTVIHFFGDYGAAFLPDPLHTFTTITNTTPPQDFGFIPEPLKFTSTGKPVASVSPGAQVNATVNVQLWSSTATGYCPTCILQYVVAVSGVGAAACVPDVDLIGPYPGVTMPVSVNFNAPMTPGLYNIYSGITLEYSCNGVVAAGPDIGVLIVR